MKLIPLQDVSTARTLPTSPALSPEDAERTASVLKAVADPVRLRLFAQLATGAGETCVCDLPDVGVSQPTVSHHLRKLREAGLIDSERRGTWVYYRATERGREVLGAVQALNGRSHG
ncbi:ArsR family transcriptional regulator [Intrasporangium chromatireducens Q5-1]|uniref:ArsR family transcriptional regulator n=1 Tax=Intrasporangium chromatireducens Q5-1 TaxID=584657 RepID=W9GKG4_9MICO|nr:ArsR family transcriptional regulator [Intrasporangium chromatireducens Q5-1]